MSVEERLPEPSNPVGMDGIEFIEYATSQPQALGTVLQRMGFMPVAHHRSREVTLYRQGGMNLVVNSHNAREATPAISAPRKCSSWAWLGARTVRRISGPMREWQVGHYRVAARRRVSQLVRGAPERWTVSRYTCSVSAEGVSPACSRSVRRQAAKTLAACAGLPPAARARINQR